MSIKKGTENDISDDELIVMFSQVISFIVKLQSFVKLVPEISTIVSYVTFVGERLRIVGTGDVYCNSLLIKENVLSEFITFKL